MAMISLVNIPCPHCLRDNAVLEVECETVLPLKNIFALMAVCRSCSGAVIAEVEPTKKILNAGGGYFKFVGISHRDVVLNGDVGFSNEWGAVIKTYPEAIINSAPADTPPRISKFFIEAKDNFNRGNYETCGSLCRKVIDLATQLMANAEDISAWKLQKRIEQLRTKGVITQEMYDWADIVRLDGNGQTHSEDEFDRYSAKIVLDFTETFLLYAFTLPAMVKNKREAEGR